MALDDVLLREYMHGFHGYGSYEAPYWFLGMEEGSTGTVDEIARRIGVWAKRGRRELEDLVGFHQATGLDEWFQPGARLQPTWRGLIRVLPAAEGERADVERVRSFQRAELGRAGGTNALVELFSLPSRSTGHWLYGGQSAIPCLRNRRTYYREVGPARIRHLQERIQQHRPKAVICYGLGHRLWFERIAGPFASCDLPRLGIAFCNSTLIALIPHTSQGVSNGFIQTAGAIIREGVKTGPPPRVVLQSTRTLSPANAPLPPAAGPLGREGQPPHSFEEATGGMDETMLSHALTSTAGGWRPAGP